MHGARLLALRHGIAVRSTAERLSGVRALNAGGAHDLIAAAAAHDRFLRRIAKAQLADMAAGRPATNRVPLDALKAEAELDQLKSDLRIAVAVNELAREQIAAAPG